jgi:hypothetical protein
VTVRKPDIMIAGLLVSCVLSTAACGSGEDSEEDEAAKSLICKAMIMMENVYLAIGSYDIDWHYISDVESRIVFRQATRHVAGSGLQLSPASAGLAAEDAVTDFGDTHSYSIVAVSELGTLWAAYVSKASGGGRCFYSVRDGVLTEGW